MNSRPGQCTGTGLVVRSGAGPGGVADAITSSVSRASRRAEEARGAAEPGAQSHSLLPCRSALANDRTGFELFCTWCSR